MEKELQDVLHVIISQLDRINLRFEAIESKQDEIYKMMRTLKEKVQEHERVINQIKAIE